MGTLEYVTSRHVAEIEDRTLAHLQIVICAKLRRNEHFTLRLPSPEGMSGPVTVLWMNAAVPLRFTYALADPHSINPTWLRLLAEAAASSTGLWVIPEPAPVLQEVVRPQPQSRPRTRERASA